MFDCSAPDCEFEKTAVDPLARTVEICLESKREIVLSQTMEPQDLSPLFSDEWTGSQVWNCSIKLANYMEDCIKNGTLDLEGKPTIELGSGCGLVGLVACQHGADVTATDQEPMVRLIARNGETNLKSESEISRFRPAVLTWANEDDLIALGRDTYDVILISDCLNPIYGEDSYKALADTIVRLANAKTRILLAYQHRGTGSASQDLIETFFGHLRMYKAKLVRRIEDDELDIYEFFRV